VSSKTRRILFVVALVVVVVLTTTPPIAARTAEPPLLRPNAPMLDVADEAAKIGDGIFKILDWLLGSDDADE